MVRIILLATRFQELVPTELPPVKLSVLLSYQPFIMIHVQRNPGAEKDTVSFFLNGNISSSDSLKDSLSHIPDRLTRIKYVLDSFNGYRLSLNEMASEACMSRFHFVRCFKKRFGLTPYQYVVNIRIRKAKELLKMGYPVTEVSILTGYPSIFSFSKQFKKVVGNPPSAFCPDKHSNTSAKINLEL